MANNMWRPRLGIVLLILSLISCSRPNVIMHVEDTNGQITTTLKNNHKWLVINYWAHWCESCYKEIPELNSFNQNKPANVLMLGSNYDKLVGEDLEMARKKMRIAYPALLDDPASLWQIDSLSVLPVTVVINPQGEVVKKIIGPTTAKKLLQIIHSFDKPST
jgi:thiol-disulfide isomerase/thioredoxin